MFDGVNHLQLVSMTNCNALKNVVNFDMTQVPNVTLNNSYDVEELYMSNNRVRKIGKNRILFDNCLQYQIMPCYGSYLTITDLYKGRKYNDTCIADVNLEVNGKWMYGEINE